MNEGKPIDEFWTGVGIGALLLFAVIFLLFPGVSMSLSVGLAGPKAGMKVWQLGFALLFVGGVIGMGVYWIRAIIYAFINKRSYYGIGLLSVMLIPILFFGACTMLIPPIHISPPHPQQNPPVVGVDSPQNRK